MNLTTIINEVISLGKSNCGYLTEEDVMDFTKENGISPGDFEKFLML